MGSKEESDRRGKAVLEATAIVNPYTNKLAVTKGEIKSVSLKYCVDTLANNEPEENFQSIIENKKLQVKHFLSLKGGSFLAKEETFFRNLEKFKMSGKRNYDFLTKAGK